MVRVRVVVVGALVVRAISPLGGGAGLLSPHEGDDLGGGAPGEGQGCGQGQGQS